MTRLALFAAALLVSVGARAQFIVMNYCSPAMVHGCQGLNGEDLLPGQWATREPACVEYDRVGNSKPLTRAECQVAFAPPPHGDFWQEQKP